MFFVGANAFFSRKDLAATRQNLVRKSFACKTCFPPATAPPRIVLPVSSEGWTADGLTFKRAEANLSEPAGRCKGPKPAERVEALVLNWSFGYFSIKRKVIKYRNDAWKKVFHLFCYKITLPAASRDGTNHSATFFPISFVKWSHVQYHQYNLTYQKQTNLVSLTDMIILTDNCKLLIINLLYKWHKSGNRTFIIYRSWKKLSY